MMDYAFLDKDMDISLADLDNEEEIEVPELPDIEEVITDKHIKIPTTKLVGFLTAAKSVISAANRDVISRAISITTESGNAVFRVTDGMNTYLEMRIPLINSENVLVDHFALLHGSLEQIIRGASSSFIFLLKDGKYFARIMGGDLILETHLVNVERFSSSYKFTKTLQGFSSTKILKVIKDLSPLVQGSSNAAERRIVFSNGEAMANQHYTLSKTTGSFPDMDLRARDFSVLRAILKEGTQISAMETALDSKIRQIKFSTEDLTYVFVPSSTPIPPAIKQAFSEVVREDSIKVDFNQFSRLVEISSQLEYSTGRLKLDLDPLNNVVVTLLTKKGAESRHLISGVTDIPPKPLTGAIEVQSEQLHLALKTYKTLKEVKISLSARGVGISGGDYTTAIYCHG